MVWMNSPRYLATNTVAERSCSSISRRHFASPSTGGGGRVDDLREQDRGEDPVEGRLLLADSRRSPRPDGSDLEHALRRPAAGRQCGQTSC